MRRKFSPFLSLCVLLSAQLSCSTVPPFDDPPDPNAGSTDSRPTLEESLKAAGFTTVVETDQSGPVTTKILMTEEGSSVVFGLDDRDPEVLFQLLTPDGTAFVSVFEDKVVLDDGS